MANRNRANLLPISDPEKYRKRVRFLQLSKPISWSKYIPGFCILMIIFFGSLFSETDSTMSDWSPFTTCSASCGGGVKTRYLTCNRSRFGGKDCSALGSLSEDQPCNVHDCNGELLLT